MDTSAVPRPHPRRANHPPKIALLSKPLSLPPLSLLLAFLAR